MVKLLRANCLVVIVGLLMVGVLMACAPAWAQINIGGFNQSNRNQQDHDDDDDDHDDDDSDEDRNQGSGNQGSGNQGSGTQGGNRAFPFAVPGGSNQGGQSSQKKQSISTFPQNGQSGSSNQQFGNQQFGTQQGSNQKYGTWQGSRKIGNFSQQYQTGSQPFSNTWFKEHPQTWQHDVSNNKSWNTASATGAAAWLGWSAVQQGQGGQQQVLVGPGGARINQGQMDFRGYGRWYPLGVFTLLSGPGDQGSRMLQLAIDREGNVRGVYYDMITNATYNVSGSVRQGNPPRVSWSLNTNKFLTFRASLYQMWEPYSTVTVRLPGGDQKWQMVRMEY